MKNRSHKHGVNRIRSRHDYEYGPVQKKNDVLVFFASSFQNVIFCEILQLPSRKNITRQK